ncbi:DUF1360 domain-containing protein [Geobacillus sp. 46C-IIa]|nr:DUF1360 domain-containing protein [Geobacillus sp. 46C-IIa]
MKQRGKETSFCGHGERKGERNVDDPFSFVLLCLASFRLTRLIVYDAITDWLRRPFHEWVEEELSDGRKEMFLVLKGSGLRRWFGELLSCYWCTGIWCAAFCYAGIMLWPTVFQPFIVLLAIAGGAALIETIVSKWLS